MPIAFGSARIFEVEFPQSSLIARRLRTRSWVQEVVSLLRSRARIESHRIGGRAQAVPAAALGSPAHRQVLADFRSLSVNASLGSVSPPKQCT